MGLTTKEIAAKIRVHLKKHYPLCKWSVTRNGNEISISLMGAPFSPWCDLEDEGVQRRIADAMEHNPLCSYPSYFIEQGSKALGCGSEISGDYSLSEEVKAVLQEVYDYSQAYKYSRSDVYAGLYICTSLYFKFSIGKDDKKFTKISI